MKKNYFNQRFKSESFFWPLTYFSWIYYHWMGSSLLKGSIFSLIVATLHLYLWIFRYNLNTFERGKQAQTEVSNIIFYCLIAINTATVPLLVVIWMFRGWKRIRNFVSEIASVDDKLSKNFSESPRKNSTVSKLILSSYGVPIIAIAVLISRDMSRRGAIATDVVRISGFEYIYYYQNLGVKLYVQCLFASCVLILGDRYAQLNSIIEKMTYEYDTSNPKKTRLSLNPYWLPKIRELRSVNRKLFFAAQDVSEAFTLQIFITGVTSLTLVIQELYNFYLMNFLPCGFEPPNFIEYLLECVIVIGQFYIVMLSCSRTYSKERSIARLLQDLTVDDQDLRVEIKIFSLQLMHYKIKFSACGLWDVDLTFTVTIVSTILTYLIILVQIGNLPNICRNGFVPQSSSSSSSSTLENFTDTSIIGI